MSSFSCQERTLSISSQRQANIRLGRAAKPRLSQRYLLCWQSCFLKKSLENSLFVLGDKQRVLEGISHAMDTRRRTPCPLPDSHEGNKSGTGCTISRGRAEMSFKVPSTSGQIRAEKYVCRQLQPLSQLLAVCTQAAVVFVIVTVEQTLQVPEPKPRTSRQL